MSRKSKQKPYWEMTTEELAEATKEFDEEFVADTFRPLTPEERAEWEAIRRRLRADHAKNGEQTIAVRVDRDLLKRCTALAKKKKISRDALVARGLKALLAAEGEA
ncbi:MAG: hypothetical protein JNM56_14580 [Planctomycetia bacterium]|nr:hypothetical protein [Planctomycetia bacterium]